MTNTELAHQGFARCESLGVRVESAAWITRIGGVAHRIEAQLIPGHSALDHLADYPLAALARVCDRTWSTRYAFERAAYREMARALTGGPLIRITRIGTWTWPGTAAEEAS